MINRNPKILVLLLCGLIPTLLMSCGDTGADGEDASQGFNVVTFNILHGIRNEDPAAQPYDRFPERLALIQEELTRRHPSAVLLQEVVLFPLPDYPDVLGSLLQSMNANGSSPYDAVFGALFGWEPVTNGGCSIGQLTLTNLPMSGEPHNTSVSLFRSVLHTRIVSPLGPVDIYNVHIEGTNEGDPAPAITEIENVLDFVENTSGQDGLIVLAGDFNSEEDSPVFEILEEAGFVDLGAASGLECTASDFSGCTANTIPLGEQGNRTDERIDYILLKSKRPHRFQCAPLFNNAFPLEEGGVLWASDHIGLNCSLW